ncbi:MAG: single-stranded-DNA-specific exonuclease RecJ [Saprospiraceae bacterium]|nr:single-stranded-DNA-specific exonuclease RecJ [Saprospiraceae bacterium]
MSTKVSPNWKPVKTDESVVARLQEALGIHPVCCRLLVQRGITTEDEARRFLRPSMADLHDPFLMKDMDLAIERLSQAVERGEKIVIYGDYDADGTTAVALLYSFLEGFHPHLDYYFPDRYKEGYGLSFEGINYAHEKGAKLMVVADCGITALTQAEHAKSLGIDLIICDHHMPGPVLPHAVAVLNPKRVDCEYPYKELSGCGIAFKLTQGYVESHGLDPRALDALLDLLAISIAADIVPITGENRILAYFGLHRLNSTERPGLNALIDLSKRSRPLLINDIVFGLAPLINAAGRLADADQAVRLMLARDRTVGADYARVLNYRNQLRREFDQRIFSEAIALFEHDEDKDKKSSIVLFQPHWHKGVVGIVASRMVEKYHRPSVILTQNEGIVAGSARSIYGFDLYQALLACSDLLLTFGGHAHAAGLNMLPEQVPAFKDRFEALVQAWMQPDEMHPEIDIVDTLTLEEITPGFWKTLRQFAPFGPGNDNPVFASYGVFDSGSSRPLNGGHLRLSLRQNGSPSVMAVAFGQAEAYPQVATRRPFDLCYTLQENHWADKTHLQLVVKDFHF